MKEITWHHMIGYQHKFGDFAVQALYLMHDYRIQSKEYEETQINVILLILLENDPFVF